MIDPGRALLALERVTAEVPVLLAGADLGAAVPACPEWTVTDLVVHLGKVHVWAEQCIRLGNPKERDLPGPGRGAAALAGWYRHCADLLLETLRSTSPDQPCWTFGPPPREASFWFRRQAHEAAVHRWDLGTALGRDLGYPSELAADGVAEVVTIFFPRQVRLQRIRPLTRSLAVAVDGGPTWVLHGDGTGESAGVPDAVVTGPAEALVLLLWGRLALDDPGLSVTGSREAAVAVLSAGIVP
ncbi:MAG TPA: maleylpyruvate isomerase family mycothiol-dependent enzyme [Propionibacteriaceae bacterium]|nr:maleylpyruvate isomerase family mycothiol-dependent enzyme [Propionibacteriaceae bacterium]